MDVVPFYLLRMGNGDIEELEDVAVAKLIIDGFTISGLGHELMGFEDFPLMGNGRLLSADGS